MRKLAIAFNVILTVQWLGSAGFEFWIGDYKKGGICLLLGLFFLLCADYQLWALQTPAETAATPVKCPPHQWSYDPTTSDWTCLRPSCAAKPG